MKQLLSCALIIVLLTSGIALAEVVDKDIQMLGDRLVEFTLESAAWINTIAHDDTFLDSMIPISIWESEMKDVVQKLDYARPLAASINVWNGDSYNFDRLFKSNGIDLSEDTLSALGTKLFTMPFDIFPGMRLEVSMLKSFFTLNDVYLLEDFDGIAYIFLFYGHENRVVISAYGSAKDGIVMSKSSIAYMEEANDVINSCYTTCYTYFGSPTAVWKVDLSDK